ncbi:MAG: tetratricopeptide repeat protein [Eubacteriales bacterium]|nr:tetratricopeptide repeat protein [Eubacteriales bacterium]
MAHCEKCGKEHQPRERCAKCAKETKPKIKIGSLVIGKAALIAVICSLLVVTIGGFAGVRAVRSHQAKENLGLGNAYLLEENYEQAILAYNKTIKKNPTILRQCWGRPRP